MKYSHGKRNPDAGMWSPGTMSQLEHPTMSTPSESPALTTPEGTAQFGDSTPARGGFHATGDPFAPQATTQGRVAGQDLAQVAEPPTLAAQSEAAKSSSTTFTPGTMRNVEEPVLKAGGMPDPAAGGKD